VSKSKECVISAELAYAMRDIFAVTNLELLERDHGFRCVSCKWAVRVVKSGTSEAHFEHLRPNPNCSLSYEAQPAEPMSSAKRD
jgi:hypothetical protein